MILILLGLNIGGWLPRWRAIESIGSQAWRFIQPLGKRLLPVNSVTRALMMGMVWGWLPCGMVYSVLLLAAASGSPFSGACEALYELTEGVSISPMIPHYEGALLGTLPSMVTAGMAAGVLHRWLQRAAVKKTFAVIIILFGVCSPWLHTSMHHMPAPG